MPTRLENRVSSRFQSNHQRGYFSRKRIISSGPANRMPPAPTTTVVVVSAAAPVSVQVQASAPETVPSTIAIGMTVNTLKNVVRRLRSRSGYSTWNWTGWPSVMAARYGSPQRHATAPKSGERQTADGLRRPLKREEQELRELGGGEVVVADQHDRAAAAPQPRTEGHALEVVERDAELVEVEQERLGGGVGPGGGE